MLTPLRSVLVLALLLSASAVEAQVLENPTAIVFSASSDHDTSDLGQPKVKDYALELIEPGATVSQTLSLGKPTPDASRDITIDFIALRPQLKLTPGEYTVRVVARGPGGEARSQPSSPFVLSIQAPTAPGPPQPRKSSAPSPARISSSSPFSTAVGPSFTGK